MVFYYLIQYAGVIHGPPLKKGSISRNQTYQSCHVCYIQAPGISYLL